MDFTNKMRLLFLTDFFPKLTGKTYNIIDSTGDELEGYKTVMQMKYKKKGSR
jgi:hypothetical protein